MLAPKVKRRRLIYKGGGGGDVKGCMLNTGVGHSASASYSLLILYLRQFEPLNWHWSLVNKFIDLINHVLFVILYNFCISISRKVRFTFWNNNFFPKWYSIQLKQHTFREQDQSDTLFPLGTLLETLCCSSWQKLFALDFFASMFEHMCINYFLKKSKVSEYDLLRKLYFK